MNCQQTLFVIKRIVVYTKSRLLILKTVKMKKKKFIYFCSVSQFFISCNQIFRQGKTNVYESIGGSKIQMILQPLI
jgi:hypothetical protein